MKRIRFLTLHPAGTDVDLTKDEGQIPYYCVCGGVPAHIIRQYNIKTGKWEKPYNK